MTTSTSGATIDRVFLVFLRLTIGWTFLYAAIHHYNDWTFVPGFLSHTKTFHGIYAPLSTGPIATVLTVLVEYGHLLIGLSLISGLMVRISAVFGALIMVLYWTAHMDFPYIENINNYLIDFHIVYAGALVYLIARSAGHVYGLDAWASQLPAVQRSPMLRPLVA